MNRERVKENDIVNVKFKVVSVFEKSTNLYHLQTIDKRFDFFIIGEDSFADRIIAEEGKDKSFFGCKIKVDKTLPEGTWYLVNEKYCQPQQPKLPEKFPIDLPDYHYHSFKCVNKINEILTYLKARE